MVELEFSTYVEFLKVDDVLPSFSNVVEFMEISHLPNHALPPDIRIGALDGKFFVFSEAQNGSSGTVGGQSSFSIGLMKLLRTLLSPAYVEKLGKYIWFRFVSNLDSQSSIKRLFINLRNNRVGI